MVWRYPFEGSFPGSLWVCIQQGGTIAAVLLFHNEVVDWNVTFIRDFNDWELDGVVSFMTLIYSNISKRDGEDGMWSRLKRIGLFDNRSFYNVLRAPPWQPFPCRSIWHSKAPPRVCFFVWSAAWDKIWTCDNLMRRGYSMATWCCMCGCNGETVDHLLLHCSMAGGLWSFVFRSFGIKWVVELLFGWHNGLGKSSLIFGI